MATRNTTPRSVLVPGAVYWADGGRQICARCAGQSALCTGHDLSGQKVARVTVEDVRAWPDDLGALACEAGCTTLATVAGPDGWSRGEGGRIVTTDRRVLSWAISTGLLVVLDENRKREARAVLEDAKREPATSSS